MLFDSVTYFYRRSVSIQIAFHDVQIQQKEYIDGHCRKMDGIRILCLVTLVLYVLTLCFMVDGGRDRYSRNKPPKGKSLPMYKKNDHMYQISYLGSRPQEYTGITPLSSTTTVSTTTITTFSTNVPNTDSKRVAPIQRDRFKRIKPPKSTAAGISKTETVTTTAPNYYSKRVAPKSRDRYKRIKPPKGL